MKIFKDMNGLEWSIQLTIDSARRVKNLLGVDLLDIESGEPPLITRLGTDDWFLCDLVYVLVKPQADERGLSDEQFGASLGGNALLMAQAALYDELIDFFRSRGRQDRATALIRQGQIISKAVEKAEGMIRDIDVDKGLEEMERSIAGSSFTTSPGSSGSTPVP